jgi:hypothetical protein
VSNPPADSAGLRFTSFRVTGELRCDDASLLQQAQQALPPGWSPVTPDAPVDLVFSVSSDADGPRRRFTLAVNGVAVASSLRVATVLDELESAARTEVARRAPGMVFVHAGVVGVNGRAIVLPGLSAAGKTTLVQALLQQGAQYGSDDYAVIDEMGRVHAYPRRLSIRQGGHRRERVSAQDLAGAQELTNPLPIGLVAVTKYVLGATWSPQPLSAGQVAMALFSHTLAARERPEEAISLLGRAANSGLGLAGDRGESADCATQLLAALRTLDSQPR